MIIILNEDPAFISGNSLVYIRSGTEGLSFLANTITMHHMLPKGTQPNIEEIWFDSDLCVRDDLYDAVSIAEYVAVESQFHTIFDNTKIMVNSANSICNIHVRAAFINMGLYIQQAPAIVF